MKKRLLVICLGMVLLLCSGCLIRFSYKKGLPALHYQAEASFSREDTLHLQNFFLCKQYKLGLYDMKGSQGEVRNADSAWALFREALSQQPLPLVFGATPKATCDSALSYNHRLKKKQIDLDDIRAWGGIQADGKMRLVPIIHFWYTFRANFYGAGAGFGGGGMYRNVFLTIHVYVFRGEELVYSRGMYYTADSELLDSQDHEAPVTSLEQKHWNELVRLVMKPYVKQLAAEVGD